MIARTAKEFIDATVSLLIDPARRASLGKLGRAKVEQEFSFQGLTQAYEKLHAELFQ
jgi:hypothetical protein